MKQCTWYFECILLLVGIMLICFLYKRFKFLVKKVKQLLYLNYSSDLTSLIKKIKKSSNIADLKVLQNELDEMYAAASDNFTESKLEQRFNDAYLILLEKLMEYYEEEISEYEKQENSKKEQTVKNFDPFL